MKCPRCGNTKTFHHCIAAQLDYVVVYYENSEFVGGAIEEADTEDTVGIWCDHCEFGSLPEVFEDMHHADWPAVLWDEEEDKWYLPDSKADLDFIIVRGKGYLSDDIGETYAKLRVIHYSTSIDQLPQYLADAAVEVRNSALKRKAEIEEEG